MLAEYNGLGICVRDYIYMGGKLIAEYRPQENAYLYYATDQIGSTRIVTDDTGAVVYAAAHDPYGGIQKTWTSGYDPALKFSGKERDTESGLDYFGARYYDHSLYRFLSVDPVTTHIGYLSQTHAWNLYVYCGSNPLINIDQSGKWYTRVHYNVTYAAMMMAFKDWDPTFAHNLAHTVASACAGVDTDPSTTSEPYWESSPNADLPGGHWVIPSREQRKMWHFPDGNRYADALDIALSTLDPVEFGKALHVIQDYFSHNRYDSDHLFDSIFAWLGMSLDPDNPFHYWDAALAMAYLTLDLCYAYEQRLKAAYAN